MFSFVICGPANVIGQTDDELAQAVEICDNGFDDDADEAVDWQDEDCSPRAEEKQQQNASVEEEEQQIGSTEEEEQLIEEICDNGVDDNGNGLVDSLDGLCSVSQGQLPPAKSQPEPILEEQSPDEIPSENPQCPDNGNATDCIMTDQIPSENPQCPDNGNATDCQPPNLAPIASAGKMQKVSINESVSLSGLGSYDPDGNITSFRWAQSAGQPSVRLQGSDTIHPSFIAPIVSNESLLTFELTVKDDKGFTDTDYVDVSVNASSSSDGTSDISNLRQIVYDKMLDASLVDSEAAKSFAVKLLSYSVNGTEINVDKLDNEVDFSVNNSAKLKLIPANSTTQLQVTDMTLVSDDGTNSYLNKLDGDQWELDSSKGARSLIIDAKYSPGGEVVHYGAYIEVLQKETVPPIADAGEDQVVSGNVSVTLDGTKSSDPDGAISSFQWVQINEEPFVSVGGVDTANPSFISPSNLGKDINMTFRLTVTDNNLTNDTDDVTVLVKNTTLPKPEGSISLDPIPSTLSGGQLLNFKGTLNLSKTVPEGAYVQIRSGNGEQTDEVITLGDIDREGGFVAVWTAIPREKLYNIYASYVDISGNVFQSESYPLNVVELTSGPALAKRSNSAQGSGLTVCDKNPCIESFFNEWNRDFLNVYITANDPYSRKYINDAKEGVQELSKALKHETHNDKWNFNIYTYYGLPPVLRFLNDFPGIFINLREYNGKDECGHSEITQRWIRLGVIFNDVLTNPGCEQGVKRSTIHELMHSLGIGHTWNEGHTEKTTGDMLCSVEWYPQRGPATCRNDIDSYDDRGIPSLFDIRAIVNAYGNNGFETPNNGTIEKQTTPDEQYHPLRNAKYYCSPLPCIPAGNSFKAIDGEKIKKDYSSGHNDKAFSGNDEQVSTRTEDTRTKTKFDTQVKKTTGPDETTSTFQPYRYNKLGVSLEHPPDWKFASLKNGIQLIKEKNAVYVEIRKHDLESSNTELKEYVFNDIKERSNERQKFEVLNITETKISGNLPAYATEYTFLKTENQKDFSINGPTNKILRFWTFANGNAYTIAYVSESQDYDLNLPIALKIIDTVKINSQEKSVK